MFLKRYFPTVLSAKFAIAGLAMALSPQTVDGPLLNVNEPAVPNVYPTDGRRNLYPPFKAVMVGEMKEVSGLRPQKNRNLEVLGRG